MNIKWHPLSRVRHRQIPATLRPWILDQHSLTQRLREHFNNRFRVRVTSQNYGPALLDERQLLDMKAGTHALIRQVYLYGDEQPVVYARTIIPITSLRGNMRRLTRLGNKPLGEFLFTRLASRRAALELAAIPPGHALHRRICKETTDSRETLWARRSLFMVGDCPLVVVELFLPSLYLSDRE